MTNLLASKPAILGGTAICDVNNWPKWPIFGDAEKAALTGVLESREWGGHSDSVFEFEEAFRTQLNSSFCIATSNCTLSIYAALQVLGIRRGDEVIIPAYTFSATGYPILLLGAKPIIADINRASFNLDPATVEPLITRRTRAIVPVHYAGRLADMIELRALANQYKLFLVEDSAHAPMRTCRDKDPGSLADIACFSFQSSKTLTAGEGGALVTNDLTLAKKLRAFVDQGRDCDRLGQLLHLGSNVRMTGWQAAILLNQLKRLPDQHRLRLANASLLGKLLSKIHGFTAFTCDSDLTQHCLHFFIGLYDKQHFSGMSKEMFCKALQADGVPCHGGYAKPIYGWPPFQQYASRIESYPNTEFACLQNITFRHNLLLADSSRMDHIADAIIRIQVHSSAIAHS